MPDAEAIPSDSLGLNVEPLGSEACRLRLAAARFMALASEAIERGFAPARPLSSEVATAQAAHRAGETDVQHRMCCLGPPAWLQMGQQLAAGVIHAVLNQHSELDRHASG